MTSKNILTRLGNGEEVAGINAAIFSTELRQAFTDGARAIIATERISATLAQLAAAAPFAVASTPEAVAPDADKPAVTAVAAQTVAPVADKPAVAAVAAQTVAPDAKPLASGHRGRWLPEEDSSLGEEFKRMSPEHPTLYAAVQAIATMHNRSTLGIAMRLQATHNLITEQDVAAIKLAAQADGSRPTPQEVSVAQRPAAQPVKQAIVPVAAVMAPEPESIPLADEHPEGDVLWDDSFQMGLHGDIEGAAPTMQEPEFVAAPADNDPLKREIELVSDDARKLANDIMAHFDRDNQKATQLLDYLNGEKMVSRIPKNLRRALITKISGALVAA